MKRRDSREFYKELQPALKRPNADVDTQLHDSNGADESDAYLYERLAEWLCQNESIIIAAGLKQTAYQQWKQSYVRFFGDAFILIEDFCQEYRKKNPYAEFGEYVKLLDSFLEPSFLNNTNACGQSLIYQLECVGAFWQIDQWQNQNKNMIEWLKDTANASLVNSYFTYVDIQYFIEPDQDEDELRNSDTDYQIRLISLATQLPLITNLFTQLESLYPALQGVALRLAQKIKPMIDIHAKNELPEPLKSFINSSDSLNSLMHDLSQNISNSALILSFIDWRLPLLHWLDENYLHQHVEQALTTLTWLQKNNEFMTNCMTKDQALYNWLDQHPEAKDQLSQITNMMHQKLVQKNNHHTFPLPVLQDVRKMWYCNGLIHGEIWNEYSAEKCNLLLSTTTKHINKRGLTFRMFETYPSPLACFIDSLVRVSANQIDGNALKAEGDTLCSLMLLHPDNVPLVQTIQQAIPQLEKIVQQYQQPKASIAQVLSASMQSVLEEVETRATGSPTKDELLLQRRQRAKRPQQNPDEETGISVAPEFTMKI